MNKHAQKAAAFIANEERTNWHDASLWMVRSKRDHAIANIEEWESLRELASQIKDNVLSNLDVYLERFEAKAIGNGVQVHWAKDAEAHNQIVYDILSRRDTKLVVKSKSMLTEECQLNPYLEAKGVEVIDTDFGERIIQLREEPPSHIVMPAIHLKKEEIGELFVEQLNTQQGNNDPGYLTEAAREHLRQKFIQAGAAITGVNFAIAETGGVVVCTNEGNADMGTHLAPVQIHCMGIEKIIPNIEHLGIFTRLLARSATGQPITIFTSHYHRPRPGSEMHIILVDNGRSKHLGAPDFRNSLKCIRCGACMNTCPVYRRSGGHSYGATVPGPIGSILSPRLDVAQYSDLPFASTLCGSCSEVCPVKIDIHEQLYKWRQHISEKALVPFRKKLLLRWIGKIMSSGKRYSRWSQMVAALLKRAPRFLRYNSLNKWGKHRELPDIPEQTFKQWYQKNRLKNE